MPAQPTMTQTTVVFILALLLGIQPITTDLYLPALPALTEGFGASMAQGQHTLSALLLAFGLSQLVWGPLSDRFGRKPILVMGLILYTIAATGSAFAGTMSHLITWRIMQGLAMGAVVMCGRALVRDLYTPVIGVTVMSKGLTGLGVFACLSAPLGGYLAGHWGAKAALLALAVFGLATLCMVVAKFKETLPQKNLSALQPSSLVKTWWLILKNPIFLTYSALSFASYGVLFTFLASSSYVFIKIHGFTPPQYGLIMFGMSAFYLSGTVWCRWLIKRSGIARSVAIAGGLSVSGGSLMAILAFTGNHSPWALIFPYYLIAIGHGVHQPCGQTGAIGPFGQAAGTAAALNGFLMMLIAFVTGVWLSFASDGSAMPMILAVWFWSICISIVAWTAVQRHAKA
jgi:MFS transporter, DHA1 family, multidrug resistance protein